jgi:glycosyltransferase involved in cell wall biosynthesis
MNGYNSQEYLKDAIDSIYNQTYKNWEIIFIDNCSSDNSAKIAKSYDNKLKYYKTNRNIPLGKARNFGLKYCKGDYLAFLDTDDIWLKDKLNIQVKKMEFNKEFKLCYGGAIYINENAKKIGSLEVRASSGDVFVEQLKRYEINFQSVLIRNNIKINFDDTKQFSPDFDLFMSLASKYKVCVIKDYLVKYRKISNSLTSKKIHRWHIETKQTLDNIFSKNPSLKDKYPKEYNLAYAKVAYYKAQYLISINKKDNASLELSKYKYASYQYFILYLISLLPKFIWDFVHRFKQALQNL